MANVQAPITEETQVKQIVSWRLHILLDEAGYPLKLAESLAERHSGEQAVDLHLATELVRDGCPHETAARILL